MARIICRRKDGLYMKTFITDDFLLYNETAKELYHNTAKHLPIIDYHNHLNQEVILQDKNYTNLAEIWLAGDHYKWRAMRANGIEESYITGDKSDYEKFLAWARTVPNALGNPLYHWTHLELLRYFNIDDLLDENSAPAIWEEANEKLQSDEMTARKLLTSKKVEFIGTTDDPTDDLASHIALHKEGFEINVSPSFRPDKGLNIESEEFFTWLEKLGQITDTSIESYDAFLNALKERVDFFDVHGCRSSDHSIQRMFYAVTSKKAVDAIFTKRLQRQMLTEEEVEQYKTYTLVKLGEWYAEKGW